ncbi:MAG: aldehyde ferredoxin oxidoreductase, partial [Planctomycetota bacterium]
GVIFYGVSPKPVYLLIENGEGKLLPADEWWGKDTNETEDLCKEKYGKDAGIACIGPPGERQALLACIINDKGRAAGRSGLGAVMGSKRLKAVVAVGNQEVTMADPEGMAEAIQKHREVMKSVGMFGVLSEYGTAGITAGAVATGDAPIKNWAGTPKDFSTAKKISDDAVIAIQRRKYACWRCPIGCGGETEVPEGKYAAKNHKPEYETLGTFGTMTLNDNVESINKANEICNRAGLDTISTGCTIAFAIECFERGILTTEDTGGLQLTWGNHEAIVELTQQIADGVGFGKVLQDGAKIGAERIGRGSEEYAIHIAGEEVPMHDPRLNPGLAASYKMDATPARHTQMSAWSVEGQFAPPGLYDKKVDRYDPKGKGKIYRLVSNHYHTSACAGLCMFGWSCLSADAICDCLTYTTGKQFTLEDVDRTGWRIASLRMAFNIREGVRNVDFQLPKRIIGQPPLEDGPLKGVTVDVDTQVQEYLEEMGWDTTTGAPKAETLKSLGLDFVCEQLSA